MDWRIRKGRDWTSIDPLLGTMTDIELSEKTGIASSDLCVRRKVLGVTAFRYGAGLGFTKEPQLLALQNFILQHKLSIDEISNDCGVSKKTFQRWLKGETNLKLFDLQVLCIVLNQKTGISKRHISGLIVWGEE